MKLHKIAGNNDLRKPLQYICIDKYNIVASDAVCMLVMPKEHYIFDGDEIPEMFVHRKDWAKLAKGNYMLKMDGDHLTSLNVKTYEEIGRVKPILKADADFVYPDYISVINEYESYHVTEQIALNPNILKQLIDAMPTLYNGLKFTFYKDNVVILESRDGSEYKGMKGLIMQLAN